MIFEIPAEWDINKCFCKIDNGKIIIDHPVDQMIVERCVSELSAADKVIEDDLYSNKTNKLSTKEIIKRLRNRLHISREELGLI